MTSNPESLADSADQAGPCPRCGRVAAFQWGGASPLTPDGVERVIAPKCIGCQDSIAVVERMVKEAEPTGKAAVFEGIHWWPLAGVRDLDPDVPSEVGSAFSRG
jgi:predicted RNA-binding Zn-ribbon protein involved in translation (DUF1610 family)